MEVASVLTGRRGVSLPFTDYCEPIYSAFEHLRTARDRLCEYGRYAGWHYLEFRGHGYFDEPTPCFARYYLHTLPLSGDWDRIASGIRDSTRRNVEKAARMGVTAEIHTSGQALREFYRMHCDTRRHHGLPPQPWSFFQSIHHHVISSGRGMVVLARHGERVIAGAVFFHLGDHAVYKFGASELPHRHLRANNLVMWEAIRRYCTEGCRTFSFGRTDPEADGLRRFKNGWGATETEIHYYRNLPKEGRYVGRAGSRGRRLSRLFRAMPIPLLKAIGNAAYRHMG